MLFIAIFYVSLIGVITMLLLKRREAHTGRPNIISRMGRGADGVCHTFFSTISRTISYMNRHTLIVIGQLVAFHLLLRIRRVYVEIKHRTLENPHGRKVLNAVRGRGEVKNHGASLYLRRISSEGK